MHIPGAHNTAADYLSRLEADPKDKLVMKIREYVQIVPIEKRYEQYWGRKEAIRNNPVIEKAAVTIPTLSSNLVKQQPDIQVQLRKTNQIIIEQSKDAVLQN